MPAVYYVEVTAAGATVELVLNGISLYTMGGPDGGFLAMPVNANLVAPDPSRPDGGANRLVLAVRPAPDSAAAAALDALAPEARAAFLSDRLGEARAFGVVKRYGASDVAGTGARVPATTTTVQANVDTGAWLRLPQVEPEKLFDWNLTGYQETVPLTPAEVETVLRDEFDASFFSRAWDIRVRMVPIPPRPPTSAPDRVPGSSTRPEDQEPIPEWMGPTAVARAVAQVAVRHPGFRRRRAETERLARVVRRALERELTRTGGRLDLRPEVPYTVFLAFLLGVGDDYDPEALSLPRILDDTDRAALRLGVPAEIGAVLGDGIPGGAAGSVAAPPATAAALNYAAGAVPEPPTVA